MIDIQKGTKARRHEGTGGRPLWYLPGLALGVVAVTFAFTALAEQPREDSDLLPSQEPPLLDDTPELDPTQPSPAMRDLINQLEGAEHRVDAAATLPDITLRGRVIGGEENDAIAAIDIAERVHLVRPGQTITVTVAQAPRRSTARDRDRTVDRTLARRSGISLTIHVEKITETEVELTVGPEEQTIVLH